MGQSWTSSTTAHGGFYDLHHTTTSTQNTQTYIIHVKKRNYSNCRVCAGPVLSGCLAYEGVYRLKLVQYGCEHVATASSGTIAVLGESLRCGIFVPGSRKELSHKPPGFGVATLFVLAFCYPWPSDHLTTKAACPCPPPP
jgi:hypothetical protein